MSIETVEIAISYLDRFLLTYEGLSAAQDRSTYQLACMAALYTAIKLNEYRVISPDFLSQLSQGAHSSSTIEEMETCILMSLNWYMNPPTSFSFVREYLNLIPEEFMDLKMKDVAYDLSKLQCDAAVKLYEFSTIPASMIACCSLMNELESMSADSNLVASVQFMTDHIILDCSNCIHRLHITIARQLMHR